MYTKVYLILAHTKPEQVENLIRLLQDGKSLFFIHLDKKVNPIIFRNCAELESTRFIKKNVKCTWGKFSLVQATLSGFAEIDSFMKQHHADQKYHCLLLSGEDLPLKDNQKLHEYLEAHQQNSFLYHWQLPYSYWWNGGMFRFESLYILEHNRNKKIQYWLNRLLKKCGLHFLFPVNRFQKNYPGIGFFGGSQWMVISQKLLQLVLETTRKNKKFVSIFRHVLAPDELYFPMLIHHFLKEELPFIENTPTHLVLFEGNQPNPKYLDLADLKKATADNILFARKFDQAKNHEAMKWVMQNLRK